MKKAIYWVFLLILVPAGPVWALDLATFTAQNPGFSENYKFNIDIYAVSMGDSFELGDSDLRIQFNEAVLSNPLLSLQHAVFHDNTLYDAMSVESVSSGIIRLVIAPKGTTGTILPDTNTRLARITFDVDPTTYLAETSGIVPAAGTSTVSTAAGDLVLIQFTGTHDVSLVCTPSISGTPATSVAAGGAYAFTPTVTGGCDPLSFEIQNKPSWAAFDTGTGELSGTPTGADVGSYNDIIITVVDPDLDEADLPAFDIEVTATCQAPTISGTPDYFAKVGAVYSFAPTVSNGCSPLGFSSANEPAWASLNALTGALTGTPVSADAGLYTGIVISVTDGNSDSDALTAFDIEVCEATAITGTPATSIAAESAYGFTPTYSGCGNPTFQISNRPTWAGFNPATGALTGTPAVADAGTYSNIVISATDETNDGATLTAFDIEVTSSGSISRGGGGGGGGGCFISTIVP